MILLIEDDNSLRELLKKKLQEHFVVDTAKDGETARKKLSKNNYDVVLLDIRLPDVDGTELLKEFSRNGVKFIVITGYGDVKTAVQCMKLGACDFIQKPFNFELLEVTIRKALKEKRLEEENRALKSFLFKEKEGNYLLETRSESFRKVLDIARKVANTELPVLIRGETGVGKEVLAKYIHAVSDRKDKPFVVVDCTAIPEHLFESELFGYEKGAFTGANTRKLGLVELANGGTLFFDEIGEMPLSIQAKLLRFMETKKFRRVGGLKDVEVDVKIICATNKDLYEKSRRGEFREDLYFRINTVEIEIPPLRERREDIPLLVEFFLKKYGKKIRKETMKELVNYPWEGNVRELKNVIERACILSTDEYVDEAICLSKKSVSCVERIMEKLPSLEELENMYLKFLYEKLEGDVDKMAVILGCSRRTVFRKLKRLREGKVYLKDATLSKGAS
ncbi:MAG: sigma-54-dependent Fis family transcriptional regulator [Aquifex sp.]|nr:MAG: sigma-54-dependent Fis family transcriptional regulator [Aquifex sp.]